MGAMLVGMGGMLGSAGMFLTKLILGKEDRVKKIVEESTSYQLALDNRSQLQEIKENRDLSSSGDPLITIAVRTSGGLGNRVANSVMTPTGMIKIQ